MAVAAHTCGTTWQVHFTMHSEKFNSSFTTCLPHVQKQKELELEKTCKAFRWMKVLGMPNEMVMEDAEAKDDVSFFMDTDLHVVPDKITHSVTQNERRMNLCIWNHVTSTCIMVSHHDPTTAK